MSRLDNKEISIYVSRADWRRIRDEAARRRMPMSHMLLEWIDKELKRLREEER